MITSGYAAEADPLLFCVLETTACTFCPVAPVQQSKASNIPSHCYELLSLWAWVVTFSFPAAAEVVRQSHRQCFGSEPWVGRSLSLLIAHTLLARSLKTANLPLLQPSSAFKQTLVLYIFFPSLLSQQAVKISTQELCHLKLSSLIKFVNHLIRWCQLFDAPYCTINPSRDTEVVGKKQTNKTEQKNC